MTELASDKGCLKHKMFQDKEEHGTYREQGLVNKREREREREREMRNKSQRSMERKKGN